jgi:hypothetical protein
MYPSRISCEALALLLGQIHPKDPPLPGWSSAPMPPGPDWLALCVFAKTWRRVDLPISRLLMGGPLLIGDPTTQQYARRNMASAPPIVAWRHPSPKFEGYFIIIDGRHRVSAAFLRGETRVNAYVPEGVSESSGAVRGLLGLTRRAVPSRMDRRW